MRPTRRRFERNWRGLFRVRTAFAFQEKAIAAAFEQPRRAFYEGLWRRVARNIGAEIEALPDDFFRIRRGARVTFVRRQEVMLECWSCW